MFQRPFPSAVRRARPGHAVAAHGLLWRQLFGQRRQSGNDGGGSLSAARRHGRFLAVRPRRRRLHRQCVFVLCRARRGHRRRSRHGVASVVGHHDGLSDKGLYLRRRAARPICLLKRMGGLAPRRRGHFRARVQPRNGPARPLHHGLHLSFHSRSMERARLWPIQQQRHDASSLWRL